MPGQATKEMIQLVAKRLKEVPGPQGSAEYEPYMAALIDQCDALAMFAQDGGLMWAWSQDKMNSWYWHVDVDPATPEDIMYSNISYDYVQADDTRVNIPNENRIVADFMAEKRDVLFFNGNKFHTTKKEKSTDDNVTYVVMGNQDGRGLHCAISPGQDCMVVAAANPKAMPSEYYITGKTTRQPGKITINAHILGGEFRQFAPGALGV